MQNTLWSKVKDVFKREEAMSDIFKDILYEDDQHWEWALHFVLNHLEKEQQVSPSLWKCFLELTIARWDSNYFEDFEVGFSMDSITEKPFAIFEKFLSKGADPNIRLEYRKRPILIAAFFFFPRLIPLLLRYGADVNATDEENFTIFHIIAMQSYLPDEHVILLQDILRNCQTVPRQQIKTIHAETPSDLLDPSILHPQTLLLLP
jgi:ankyrin repeat protein